MLISEICKNEKDKQHTTYQDIANKANLSVSTVTNFLSHGTKAPSIYTVGPICAALGVSLDKYFGVKQESEDSSDEMVIQEKLNSQAENIKILEDRIKSYKRVLRIAGGIIILLIIACGVLAVCQPIKLA